MSAEPRIADPGADPGSPPAADGSPARARGEFAAWSARAPRADAAAVERRSRTLRRVRRVIAVSSAFLAASWLTVLGVKGVSPDFLEQFTSIGQTEDGLTMRRPRFVGADEDGRVYAVTAASASQRRDEPDAIFLARPAARSGAGLLDELAARADEGVYGVKDKILDLAGDVVFAHGRGEDRIIFASPAARVFLDDKRVRTESGVSGAGRMGLVRANALEADDRTGDIRLSGDVRIRLNLDQLGGAGLAQNASGAEDEAGGEDREGGGGE